MFNKETNYASPAVEMLDIDTADIIGESNDNETPVNQIKKPETPVANS